MHHQDQTADAATQPRQAATDSSSSEPPHECEFCSPEPEIIPAPWEHEPIHDGHAAADYSTWRMPTRETINGQRA